MVAAHMHKTPFFFRKKVASFDLCKLLKLSWHDHTTQLERQKNVDFLPCSFLTCVVMLSITCAAFTIQNDGVSNSVKLPCYAWSKKRSVVRSCQYIVFSISFNILYANECNFYLTTTTTTTTYYHRHFTSLGFHLFPSHWTVFFF